MFTQRAFSIPHIADDGSDRVLSGKAESGNVAAWSSDGKSLLIIEQVENLARVFRHTRLSRIRELVREIRFQEPAGLTVDILLSQTASRTPTSAAAVAGVSPPGQHDLCP
jgi:hypothetical protein